MFEEVVSCITWTMWCLVFKFIHDWQIFEFIHEWQWHQQRQLLSSKRMPLSFFKEEYYLLHFFFFKFQIENAVLNLHVISVLPYSSCLNTCGSWRNPCCLFLWAKEYRSETKRNIDIRIFANLSSVPGRSMSLHTECLNDYITLKIVVSILKLLGGDLEVKSETILRFNSALYSAKCALNRLKSMNVIVTDNFVTSKEK